MPGFLAEHQESPRVNGYKDGLAASGIEFREEFILNRHGTGTSKSETEELVMKLLRDGTKVDAIITSSDRAAFGALKALGKVGYYEPEDVRLISFDNSPYSMMASSSITLIDRNPKELARKACEILLAEINGEEVSYENIIEVSLVERDSTRQGGYNAISQKLSLGRSNCCQSVRRRMERRRKRTGTHRCDNRSDR